MPPLPFPSLPDFRCLFEASPHPYLILQPDPSFTIIAVNDQYLAATGTQRELIVGRGLFEVFPDNPDDGATSGVSDLRISLNRVLSDRRQDVMGVQKYDVPLRDGSCGFEVKYWSPVNMPVFDGDGQIAYIFHHAEDITEFILSRERTTQESAERIGKVEAHAERMEAEVLRRASEVKDTNRALKEAMDQLEQREAELARLNQRLTELDRAKTEFFSNVSHEFRTPLTLMLGPLETLRATATEEEQASVEVAHRNALRLLKLVNALLDFSRLEAGQVRPVWEATDLAVYTAELASNFASACATGGVQLVIDCPTLPQAVGVDRGMWEKIVLNLLSNAFKFTLAGTIEVELRAVADEVELIVRDTGSGIPAHELPHIFERFHRVQGARGRSHEGSGIGLALVHELIRLHGGTVAVESVEGQGTCFTVRLPFGTEHLGQSNKGDAVSQSIQTQAYVEEALHWLPDDNEVVSNPAGPGRARVLVADDNADMRAYISRILESSGFSVETVPDGEAALSICRNSPPDLVLSDVMMPCLDGFALLARLRAEEPTSTLPIILLSARAGESARVEGIERGADDYLVKPFAARELVARVEGAIRLAKVRNEAHQKLTRYMAELQRSNQELDDFAYIASHDLKEPLRGLHNYASFLREDYAEQLDDEGRHYLDRMQRLVERLAALIDGLLSYSRLGSSDLPMAPVGLDTLLDEVVEDVQPFLKDRHATLIRETPLPTVACDALRVREVFQNLITNAAKYNDKDEKQIVVGCRIDQPEPVFYVRDNGIGIDPKHQESVFRIFKRLHEQTKYGGGTGAGLTIVKKIIERHGGRIWLESAPDEGTTFYFTLSREPS